MNDSNARPQAVDVPPYLPSFSHSDSCERYYTDDADTETPCTCGATKAQAWLDALVAERDRFLSLGRLLAHEDRALLLFRRAIADPAQFLRRAGWGTADAESIPSWGARAVLAALRELAGL